MEVVMPRRTALMQDETIHLPITTGSAALIYGWTLQDVVLIFWATYVLVLIVIKLPEFATSVSRIRHCVRRRFGKWRRRNGS
jgi:hypothetical protein